MQVQKIIDPTTNYLHQLKTVVNFYLANDLPNKHDKIKLVRGLFISSFSSVVVDKSRMPRLVSIVDDVFFNGLIFKTIQQTSSTLEIDYAIGTSSRAGYCKIKPSLGGCVYKIVLYQLMFDSLFKKGEVFHEVNGNHCADAFECLCSVLFHEIIHLVMFMTGKLNEHHGAEFQALAKHLFGHTKSTHGFPKHKEFKGYAINDIFVYNGKKYTIIKFNPERFKTLMEDGREWNFPYSILPDKPDKEDSDSDIEESPHNLKPKGIEKLPHDLKPKGIEKSKESKRYAVSDTFMYQGVKFTVIKLNPKNVKALGANGKTLNFPYSFLQNL